MLTVRLDDRLNTLARRAAAMEGASVSEFTRRAIAERAERALSSDASGRLADVIGTVHSGGAGDARDSGGAFAELLVERRERS
jgi:hypothetical protein